MTKLKAIFSMLIGLSFFGHANANVAETGNRLTKEGRQSQTIDVSKDLKRLGISDQDLLPDKPNIDAGTLITAAVSYATKNGISKVIIPSGNFYFSSVRNNAHLFIKGVDGVTLQGSKGKRTTNFIFAFRKASGIIIRDCDNTGIEDITLDYASDLPFSAVTVAVVDLSKRSIKISGSLGRPVTELKSDTDKSSRLSLRAFALRKSSSGIIQSVPIAWLYLSRNNINADEVNLIPSPSNKFADDDLQQIKQGDILMITERSYEGSNALAFVTYPPNLSAGNYAKNVIIYSSPAIGVAGMWQKGLTLSNLKIMPKPGRAQYVSSNADGINVVNSGPGNTITNCQVSYTGDDGISFGGNLYATVTGIDSANSIAVTERYMLRPDQKVTFVDPDDLHEIGSAEIAGVPKRSVANKQRTGIRLNSSLKLKPGTLVYLSEADRSNGIKVTGNNVSYPYSRGIYFSGVNGAVITGNTIQHTQSCAILGQAAKSIPGVSNVVIKNNTINNAFEKGATDQPGAIEISVEGKTTSAYVNKNIDISGNSVTIAGSQKKHVGILISNTLGYQLSNNVLNLRTANGSVTEIPNEQKLQIKRSADKQ